MYIYKYYLIHAETNSVDKRKTPLDVGLDSR